jgi:hypothetical protein
MAHIHINSIPQGVKRLHEIYQFDSCRPSHATSTRSSSAVWGVKSLWKPDDADTDLVHEMLPDVMAGLPRLMPCRAKLNRVTTRSWKKTLSLRYPSPCAP